VPFLVSPIRRWGYRHIYICHREISGNLGWDIALILGSCAVSFGVAYYSLSTHLRGDYLWIDNSYAELGFPKNWRAMAWVDSDPDIGESFNAQVALPNVFSAMILMIYDEKATRTYMDEYNLTDIDSLLSFAAQSLYEWALENNANATLVSAENGTITVSSEKADYLTILIKDGYSSDGSFQNLTCTFISYMSEQRLIQIIFWGSEQACLETRSTFEAILNTVRVKI
jgi:hypothetical protein